MNKSVWQSEISRKVIDWLKQQLSMAGLELTESKIRVITNEELFNFLGYEIPRGKGSG